MSSAEHRTDDSKPPITDEDLSFSMAPPLREARPERDTPAYVPPPPVVAREPEPQLPPPDTLDFVRDDMPPLRSSTPPPEFMGNENSNVGYSDPVDLPELAEDRQQFEPLDDHDFDSGPDLRPDLGSDSDDFEQAPPPRRGDDRRGGGRGGRGDRDGRGGPRGGRSGGRPGQGRPGFGRGGPPGGGRPPFGRPKPLIQDVFKRGQEVLVQVIKEGIGTK